MFLSFFAQQKHATVQHNAERDEMRYDLMRVNNATYCWVATVVP